MNIGYACLTEGVRGTNFKSCTLKNADEENLLKIIDHNLKSLENLIDYNIKSSIKLFRISSDIIPFASSDVNTLAWWDIFKRQLDKIGKKIIDEGIRVSMHPGQYTVLNSNNEDIVERAVEDLAYHTRFLDSLNVDKKNKIIIPFACDYLEQVKDNLYIFIKNNKYNLINLKNNKVGNTYDKIISTDKCLLIIKDTNNKYGIINLQGKEIIKPYYAGIKFDNNYFVMNSKKDGTLIRKISG